MGMVIIDIKFSEIFPIFENRLLVIVGAELNMSVYKQVRLEQLMLCIIL